VHGVLLPPAAGFLCWLNRETGQRRPWAGARRRALCSGWCPGRRSFWGLHRRHPHQPEAHLQGPDPVCRVGTPDEWTRGCCAWESPGILFSCLVW